MDDGRRGDLELGTIPRLIERAADRFGAAEAIADGDRRIGFVELAARARHLGRALIALGVQPGERVALWAPNQWEWIVAALGVHSVGGVLVPINTRFRGEEAAEVLARSHARLLFTVTGFLRSDYVGMLRSAALPDLERIVILRGEAPAGTMTLPDLLAAAAHATEDEARARARAVLPTDPCDLMFTSGTTGRAKAVPSTHAQTLRAFFDWSDLAGLGAGDRYLVVAPFFHSFGYKAGWLACLMTGATVVPQPTFDVGEVLSRIAAERISVLPGPPTLYQSLLARPDLDAFDLSTLRLAVTGAAVIPVELVRRMHSELGFATVLTAYGLTEATGVSTMCRRDDDAETIAMTSGRAIPGVEVRVVDDGGRALLPGEPGEVVVRGYGVMAGYEGEPDETAAVIDADGFLHTGDIGVLDARGYLRITDRKKDMFIVGGFNAYPAEIEGVLLRHEGIAQVAVVGAPDERLGEVGVAFVVPRPGASLDPEALVAWSREHMANYKVPRRVELVGELPTNATGKVMRHVLRERVRAPRA